MTSKDERELTICLLISCWIVKGGGAAGRRCHRHAGGAVVVVSGVLWTTTGCLPVIALMALAVVNGDAEGGRVVGAYVACRT